MKRFLYAAVGLIASAAIGWSATLGLFSGPMDAGNLQYWMNNLVQTINSGITPQTMAPLASDRNFLDNGAMQIAQRGTSATAGASTAGCTQATYVADRWCVDTNVTSGVGYGQVITASPAPPPGFVESMKIYRNSAALTQPVCAIQEIETARATQLQGQGVILSVDLQALAGMTGNGTVTGYVVSGTGSDEGLGTLTASPAITPAFTGLATDGSAAWVIPQASPVWARYSSGVITVPTAATELAVELCFTPAGSSSGATDGFAFTGVQLEASALNNASASAFDMRSYGRELAKAERFFYQINEPAASKAVATGNYQTATICDVVLPLPVPMRIAPTLTMSQGSATTWAIMIASTTPVVLASTWLIQDAVLGNTTTAVALQGTTASKTAGQGCTLVGAGGGATMKISADF
jgi:hypothetical protein